MSIYILFAITIILLTAVIILLLKNKPAAINEEALLSRLKESFGSVSLETLTKQVELGEKTLDKKKELIDQSVAAVKEELARVEAMIKGFDTDSKAGFNIVAERLKAASEATIKLDATAADLKRVLSGTKSRGQWGEKMAEDVLRLAGFVENVNYVKQKQQEAGTKPDFAFMLPKGTKVNMDVKFPFNNYLNYLEAPGEADKEDFKKKFIQDIKAKIKEVTGRDYINPSENTVDYVILFIPNEQVYAFIHETDRGLLDDALAKKVIVCSPLTLYAVLAVIRQAMDNFYLENRTGEMLKVMGDFYKQWEAFSKSFDTMGQRLDAVKKEYDELTTTRRNQLEKALRKVEDMKKLKEEEEK